MNRTIVFHSYKGGTGKTTIAANLASVYAARGKSVCILDFDFRAPSLQFLLRKRPKPTTWVNDFLDGKCKISDVLQDIQTTSKGRLAVGYANPSSEAMWEISRKDRNWWKSILKQLLDARREILDKMGFDSLIIDTSPGVQDSSMNALATSDVVILVLKYDELELEGTKELADDFTLKLGRSTAMILNRVLFRPHEDVTHEQEKELGQSVRKKFGFPILEVIPCYCDLFVKGSQSIHLSENPAHPFIQKLSRVADEIDKL